ncbi:hypothetical protein FRC12_013945 [Ceratobasidium sp. 428]|nr:hypothetical protein FRC12_013945 [Ceratobasidium sp. 428]
MLIESLFPSIQHVEVPGSLCARISTSELAVQSESMKIVNRYWNDPPGPNLGTIFHSGRRMLNLRRLTFCRQLPHPDGSDWLEGMLLLAPMLEVLELGRVFTKLDEVIGLLGATPKLRMLSYFSTFDHTVPLHSGERRSGWIACVEGRRVVIRREIS